MDTRHDDNVGICVNCTPGESQRITRDVGNAMEYFRCLIVVRQHHCIALHLEIVDSFNKARMHVPFDLRDYVPNFLVKLRKGRQSFASCRLYRHKSPKFQAKQGFNCF